jgi:hypothetical protein
MPESDEDPVFLGNEVFLVEIRGHRNPPYFNKP